jgi:hypothetical protein
MFQPGIVERVNERILDDAAVNQELNIGDPAGIGPGTNIQCPTADPLNDVRLFIRWGGPAAGIVAPVGIHDVIRLRPVNPAEGRQVVGRVEGLDEALSDDPYSILIIRQANRD